MNNLSVICVFAFICATAVFAAPPQNTHCYGVDCPSDAPGCEFSEVSTEDRKKILTTIQCTTMTGEVAKKDVSERDNPDRAIVQTRNFHSGRGHYSKEDVAQEELSFKERMRVKIAEFEREMEDWRRKFDEAFRKDRPQIESLDLKTF